MKYVPLIALVVTTSGLIVAWLNYTKSRELVCQAESNCLSGNYRIADLDTNLRTVYKGRVLDDICFTKLNFKSTGALPIEAKDFNELPLAVEIGAGSYILEAYLDTSSETRVRPAIASDSTRILIDPLLLNPEDAFSINVVTTGSEPHVIVKARITGVSEIESHERLKTAPRLSFAKWLVVWLTYVISTLIFSLTSKGLYHGHERKQSVVFLPNRAYTMWLFTLVGAGLVSLLTLIYFISIEWFFPVMVASQLGMITSMLTLMFHGSRWVVYEEVEDEEERRRLSSAYL